MTPTASALPRLIRFGGIDFQDLDLAHAVTRLAARPADARFGYLSTPNADGVYYAHTNPAFMAAVQGAWMVTSDSRVLARAAALRGIRLPFAPGSYIVRDLFTDGLIHPDDPLTVIGGTPHMLELLTERYALTNIRQHIPPMGFIRNPDAVAAAVAFVQAHPARFVFISMGPPQSELLSAQIAQRGGATGLGLNVGSSLGTLLGLNAPTPNWMENNGLVWLYRLFKEPKRLWRRYLGTSFRGLLIAFSKGGT